MSLLGVRVVHVAPGEVDLAFAFDERLTQQHGFLHAGVVAAVVDSACGYAAYSTGEGETDVLTVEFKINLLEPAVGARFMLAGGSCARVAASPCAAVRWSPSMGTRSDRSQSRRRRWRSDRGRASSFD